LRILGLQFQFSVMLAMKYFVIVSTNCVSRQTGMFQRPVVDASGANAFPADLTTSTKLLNRSPTSGMFFSPLAFQPLYALC
jgi:hypothetical protein